LDQLSVSADIFYLFIGYRNISYNVHPLNDNLNGCSTKLSYFKHVCNHQVTEQYQ